MLLPSGLGTVSGDVQRFLLLAKVLSKNREGKRMVSVMSGSEGCVFRAASWFRWMMGRLAGELSSSVTVTSVVRDAALAFLARDFWSL